MPNKHGSTISTERLHAGRRTYFLDLKQYPESGICLSISESSRVASGSFERHRVLVSGVYLERFVKSLTRVVKKADASALRAEKVEKKFEVIRREYANAYKAWNDEDDKRLVSEFDQSADIPALADLFMRQPSAILSRLRKLGALH